MTEEWTKTCHSKPVPEVKALNQERHAIPTLAWFTFLFVPCYYEISLCKAKFMCL